MSRRGDAQNQKERTKVSKPIGAKEAALRVQREQRAKEQKAKPRTAAQQMMVDDGLPPALVRAGGSPKLAKPVNASAGVTLAPPIAVQKAIAADLAEPTDDGPDFPDRSDAVKQREFKDSTEGEVEKAQDDPASRTTKETTVAKKSKTKTKAKAKAKAKSAVKAKVKTAVKSGSKVAMIADLLKRLEGCTTADVLKATGWPSVSMPAQAKAAGVTLRKTKAGRTTTYFAA